MTKRNDTYTPTDIRKTIERWYDGTATTAEQGMLVEYFATTSDADMPADIRDEAPVFRAIGARRTSPDKTLLAEIDAAIAAENAPKNRVGRRPFIARWYSIAAAASVAVILAVGIINEPPVDLNVTTPDVIAAKTPAVQDDTLTVKTERIAEAKVEQPTKQSDKATSAEGQATATTDNNDIIYVNDVAEATEVLAMVNAKLEKFEALSSKTVKRSIEKAPDISRELKDLPDIKTIMRDACSNVTLPTI